MPVNTKQNQANPGKGATMKARPMRFENGTYHTCEASEATHVMLNMPGPIPTRIIPVQQRWTWNGDTEKPTLKPSILSRCPPICECCHTFVTDGKAHFLSDCSHELAGQVLDLLDVE
jgi:hypothetical protein